MAASFRFWTVWQQPFDGDGLRLVEYSEPHEFMDLDTARRCHTAAKQGRWIQPDMRKVHVTALKVWKWGRVLSEELAPKVDRCDVHGTFACKVCEAGQDRRRAA